MGRTPVAGFRANRGPKMAALTFIRGRFLQDCAIYTSEGFSSSDPEKKGRIENSSGQKKQEGKVLKIRRQTKKKNVLKSRDRKVWRRNTTGKYVALLYLEKEAYKS